VSIIDDGVGGASPRAGSGLTGLIDRVAAQGGTLRITSDAGAGTTVTAEFPCA
jgi:signal transduction histidine kinase